MTAPRRHAEPAYPDVSTRPAPPDWHRSHSTYIAGRAALDGVDALANEMEAKWGCGRLRLLVGAELREKFDRQRYLTNQAIWHGDLEAVRQQSTRMVNAWRALDAAATAAGASRLDEQVWEVTLASGKVAAIVPAAEYAGRVTAEGRSVAVYTLDEIARLLSSMPAIVEAKIVFPGAEVTRIGPRSIPDDPLDRFHDTKAGLDDSLDDEVPF